MSLPEGLNIFHASLVDAFGNSSNRVSTQFTVDTIAPAILDLAPTTGVFTNQRTVTISGRVSEAAALKVGALPVALNSDLTFSVLSELTEGQNTIVLEATDPAGNTGTRTTLVFLDTIPPDFVLLQPAAGSVTNQAFVTLSGRLSETAALFLNQEHLPLESDNSFSKMVMLVEGNNDLSLRAIDRAGNVTSRALRIVRDTVAPKLMSLSPANGATMTNSQTRIVGSFDDAIHVTMIGSDGTQISHSSTFDFAVNLQPGANTFTFIATDQAGNQTQQAVSYTLSTGVSIAIVSPSPNQSINGNRVLVRGTVAGTTSGNVFVNGRAATIVNGEFLASATLSPGNNNLAITAISLDGQEVSASVAVNSVEPTYFPVKVDTTTGTSPLTLVFNIDREDGGTYDVTYEADLDGDGVVDVSNINVSSSVAYTYSRPGLYVAKFTATDYSGFRYPTVEVPIVVIDPASIDMQLRAIWSSMNGALKEGDTEKALTFLTSGAREKYARVFNLLKGDFQTIIASYSTPILGTLSDTMAEYAVMRAVDNEGDTQVFFIYFVKTESGKWLIETM